MACAGLLDGAYSFREMSIGDIDFEGGLRRLADRRIEEAMREGKFSNLRGMGKPLDLEPMPADEKARLTWWCLRLMKNNDFTPDEIRLRKEVDLLKIRLAEAALPSAVAMLVEAINTLVRRINTLGTNAMSEPMAPLSLERELARAAGRGENR